MARYVVARDVLPMLNPGARILSVLGSTVKVPPAPSVDVVKSIATGEKTDYSLSEILSSSGILTDTWMQSLAAEHVGANVSFIGTWPGLVKTHLIETSDTFPKWIRPFLAWGEGLVAMKPEKSGSLHAAIITSPNAARRPVSYFNVELQGRRTNPLAYDKQFQAWVLAFLEKVVHGDMRRETRGEQAERWADMELLV